MRCRHRCARPSPQVAQHTWEVFDLHAGGNSRARAHQSAQRPRVADQQRAGWKSLYWRRRGDATAACGGTRRRPEHARRCEGTRQSVMDAALLNQGCRGADRSRDPVAAQPVGAHPEPVFLPRCFGDGAACVRSRALLAEQWRPGLRACVAQHLRPDWWETRDARDGRWNSHPSRRQQCLSQAGPSLAFARFHCVQSCELPESSRITSARCGDLPHNSAIYRADWAVSPLDKGEQVCLLDDGSLSRGSAGSRCHQARIAHAPHLRSARSILSNAGRCGGGAWAMHA